LLEMYQNHGAKKNSQKNRDDGNSNLKARKEPKKHGKNTPISLRSCLCKILERMINKRLAYVLESRKLLPEQQYGFRKGIDLRQTFS
jgi:hypothetical protein